jgi:hypothetical protein
LIIIIFCLVVFENVVDFLFIFVAPFEDPMSIVEAKGEAGRHAIAYGQMHGLQHREVELQRN